MSDPVLHAVNLSKTYTLWHRPSDRLLAPALGTFAATVRWCPPLARWAGAKAGRIARPFVALQPLTFAVRQGESLGVIGRNGSGKSTLLQLLAGTLTPTTGTVTQRGRLGALLELGSGFNLEFTGRENVYLQGSIYGISPEEMDGHFEKVAAFAEIGAFIDQPAKTYSSGMLIRLAFAVQVVLRPDVLLVDEALAVGDVFFQAKCSAYFRTRLEEGMSLIFVSHDLVSVRALCRNTIVLHQGQVQFQGPSAEAVSVFHDIHAREATRSLRGTAAPTSARPVVTRNWQSPDEIGTREAEFVSCEILDESLQPRRQFAEGEKIIIYLHVQANAELPALHGAVQIVDRHSRALYGVSTLHQEMAALSFRPGESRVLEVVLPGRLGVGEYLLDVALGWGDRGDGAFEHQCHRIGGIAALGIGRVAPRARFLGPVNLNAELEWKESAN